MSLSYEGNDGYDPEPPQRFSIWKWLQCIAVGSVLAVSLFLMSTMIRLF